MLFQSTLPRRERPRTGRTLVQNEHVSIHAPTKGATLMSRPSFCSLGFQSTLPRRERQRINRGISARIHRFNPRSHEGSDPARRRIRSRMRGFNPRSHEGSDALCLALVIRRFYVSIHAPTKGATGGKNLMKNTRMFQSTLPRRERQR